jgi:hypothetical protein
VKVGDLVKVVRSKVKGYGNGEPIGVGKIGVIVESRDLFSNQDGFVVMTSDKVIVLGSSYLEVSSESR